MPSASWAELVAGYRRYREMPAWAGGREVPTNQGLLSRELIRDMKARGARAAAEIEANLNRLVQEGVIPDGPRALEQRHVLSERGADAGRADDFALVRCAVQWQRAHGYAPAIRGEIAPLVVDLQTQIEVAELREAIAAPLCRIAREQEIKIPLRERRETGQRLRVGAQLHGQRGRTMFGGRLRNRRPGRTDAAQQQDGDARSE